MGLRVIYTECSQDFWISVASFLADNHGWQPIYWTSASEFEHRVTSRFPGVVFHSNVNAARGIIPPVCSSVPLAPLDKDLLQRLAPCESIVLRMMDKMDANDSFTYTERVRLYHKDVAYWKAVLDHFQADLVVFPASPHLVYDYILFELCKLADIPTVILRETFISGLVYASPSFEFATDGMLPTYHQVLTKKNPEEPKLSTQSLAHLERVLGDYAQGIPFYLKPQLEDAHLGSPSNSEKWGKLQPGEQMGKTAGNQRNVDWCKFFAMLARGTALVVRKTAIAGLLAFHAVRMVFKRSFPSYSEGLEALRAFVYLYEKVAPNYVHHFILDPPPPDHYFVRRGDRAEENDWSGLEFRLYRHIEQKKKERYAQRYGQLSAPVDFTKPYVFVALHYQPERSTCPEGETFADQRLMIELLSRVLPDGWLLYVKEHPVQFTAAARGEHTRFNHYYDDLASLPNVRLVPISVVPFDLIDHAMAVATITGMVGWEAVVRGKPTLVFGHPFYMGCEGVFYTPTVRTCKQALERIADGYRPDFAKVKLFLHTLEQFCVRGSTEAECAVDTGVTMQENAQNIANLLLRTVTAKKRAA
jgi:Capsule polysaccharide biosynthesis protein